MSTEKKTEKSSFDDLAEDIFGLNIRGIKTIWMLFANPAAVFEAAMASDWQRAYTPSIRLWFSIMAVLLFFQFIWAGDDSFLQDSYRHSLADHSDRLNGQDLDEIIQRTMNYYTFVFPFVSAIFLMFGALVTFVWGKGQRVVTRIRLFFAGVIPDATTTIFFTIAVAYTPYTYALSLGTLALLSTLVLCFVTAFRGMKGIGIAKGRIWRAGLYSIIVLILSLASHLTAQIIAGVIVRTQL